MIEKPLRILEILRTLVAHRHDFVVVGAVAVAAHGFDRATKDVDIVPEPSVGNLERLYSALRELEAAPLDVGELRPEQMPVAFTVDGLARGGNWFFATKHGRIDVMQHLAGILETPEDYTILRANALVVELEVGAIRVAGYDDLIAMKYAAGRDQDLIDIRALREANRDTGP